MYKENPPHVNKETNYRGQLKNDNLSLCASHCPFSPPVDPPVGDVVDQNDLCLRVRRANHLCVVAHGHEAHVRRLCRRVVHRMLAEPKDVRFVTQKQDKDVSSIVSSLFRVYQHQALVDESPHMLGYSHDNVVSYLRVPNYHAHGHNHATVSNIPDGYVYQSYVFFYRGFSRLHIRARPPLLSEAEVADTDHLYDTL